MRQIILLAALVACGAVAAAVYLRGGPSVTPAAPAIASPQRAVFDSARHKPEDPGLGLLFDDLNARHFSGELPNVKVLWHEDLHRLDKGEYRQNGMTDGSIILINPALKEDDAEVRRTLCHEMVHVKLMTGPHRSAAHDMAFQGELSRIFDGGCFEAIRASPEEKRALEEWIQAERARLDLARLQVEAQGATVKLESERVGQTIAALNTRISSANAARSGWPSPDELAAAERQRTAVAESLAAYNAAVAEVARDQEAFNEAVRRYNLMQAYPDGLAEDRVRQSSGGQ